MKKLWMSLPLNYRILLISMVIANTGSRIFRPFMPLYVRQLGADIGQVGLFFTILAVAPVAFRILGGWISDNLGRVQTIAVGSVIGFAGFVWFWLAPNWLWLIPGGLLMNLGSALVGPSISAYTAETAGEEMRAQVFGFADSIFYICQMIGPPLGGYIAEAAGYRQLFAVATGFMAAATILRLLLTRGIPFDLSKLNPSTLKSGLAGMGALILGGGLLSWIFLVDAVRDFGLSLVSDLISLYQQDIGNLSDSQIGWLGTIGAVTMAFLMTPAGRWSDKIGERKVMVVGSVFGTLSFVVLVGAKNYLGFAAATILLHIAVSFFSPAFSSLLSKAVPAGRLGLTYGIFATTLSLIAMPGPAVGAQLWQNHSPQLPFAITAAVLLLAVIPIWFRLKPPSSTDAVPQEQV